MISNSQIFAGALYFGAGITFGVYVALDIRTIIHGISDMIFPLPKEQITKIKLFNE